MKFKIICVLVIAASLAVILGLALTGTKDAGPESMATNAEAIVRERPAQQSMLAEVTIPEELIARKQKEMESIAAASQARDQAQPAPRMDSIDDLRRSVNSRQGFSRLKLKDRVSVVSLELNMNEEQEVMLTSYLEAREAFLRSSEATYFAAGIVSGDTRYANNPGADIRPQMSTDEMTSIVNIMALELKEIQGLKNTFLNELTKQQKEKLEALPIAGSL